MERSPPTVSCCLFDRRCQSHPVGFNNLVAASDLQPYGWAEGVMLPHSYSWISPPRTLRRRILTVARSVMAAMRCSRSLVAAGSRLGAGDAGCSCATHSSRTARRCRGPQISLWSVTPAGLWDPAFGISVRSGACAVRDLHHLDPGAGEHPGRTRR
jgi:hypothetical protein